MQLSILEIAIAVVVILGVGALLGKWTHRGQESWLSRIFKDNRDFDSTLDRLSITLIIVMMLIMFGDDVSDPAKAGIVINLFVLAFNAWQALVLGKAIRDAKRAEPNGDPPP